MTPGRPPPEAERLAVDFDRRCLRGLADAAARLAGDDPAAVCEAFRTWRRTERRRAWPWLPGLCWSALEPLGVAFPVDDHDAVTLGRFLVGAETDPERVRGALAALPRRVPPPGAEGVADLGVEVRRRALEAAVDRFWGELAEMAERLRAPVAERARGRADAIVAAGRRRLEDTADVVDGHARRLDEALTGAVAGDEERAHGEPEAAEPQPEEPDAGEPEAAAAGPVPDEDVEYRRVREHRLAPVVFLAGVTLVALVWLFMIATAATR